MTEPQAPDITADKSKARPPGDAVRGDNATALKPESRAFAESAQTGTHMVHEAAGMVQDLSQSAAEATRAASRRGREAAFEVGESWRDITESAFAMHLEMSRWADDLWRRASGYGLAPSLRPARPFAGASALFGLPAIDLRESDAAYRLSVELPGLSRQDVDLEIRGDALVISGHKAEDREDAGAAYRVSERRYGRFERRTPIPADVDRAGIEAAFKDGLLIVTLPRRAAAKAAAEKVAIKG